MAIGARDFIDKLLVEKYAQEKGRFNEEGLYCFTVAIWKNLLSNSFIV